jgi:hypothetical protein
MEVIDVEGNILDNSSAPEMNNKFLSLTIPIDTLQSAAVDRKGMRVNEIHSFSLEMFVKYFT